jgi:AcrR family transcriptional regulator
VAGSSEIAIKSTDENSQFAKLRPGPGMPPSEVAASQRTRFHAAMIQLVAERGYDKVTVQDLSGVAKVSTRAFYENFRGKEDCFIRTHDLVVRRVAKHVLASQAGESDWRERLRLGFRAFVRELEREPQAARLALVDAYLDGPAARARARKAELLFGTMLADSFSHAPNGFRVAPVVIDAIIAGITGVARRHILSGTRRTPPHLADELMEWALACRSRAAGPVPTSSSIPASMLAITQSGTSDRDLSLAAVAKLAVNEGYAHLTVPRIRTAAGISRQRFLDEFRGVDDCLSAARDWYLDTVLANASRTRDAASGETGTAAAVLALFAQFKNDPALARICFAVDCVGTLCLLEKNEHRAPAVDRLAVALYGTKANKRPSVAIQASANMVWTMIGTRALSGRQDALQGLAPLLAALA